MHVDAVTMVLLVGCLSHDTESLNACPMHWLIQLTLKRLPPLALFSMELLGRKRSVPGVCGVRKLSRFPSLVCEVCALQLRKNGK